MVRLIGTGICLMLAVALAAQSPGPAAEPAGEGALLARFLDSGGPALTSYRARRTLSASSRGGKMHAELVVETSLDPETGFRWELVEEHGSGLIRSKVLKAALEAEAAMARTGDGARGALTPVNYAFDLPGALEDGLVRVGIRALRRDTLLLNGNVLLTADEADLTRVEGQLVKRPSFWTRRVWVTRDYGRVAGVRVPLRMTSRADVFIAGRSEFEMRYDYASVNGVEIPAEPDR